MGSGDTQELRVLDVARLMNVDPLTVMLWIERGELEVIDTRKVGAFPDGASETAQSCGC